MAAAETPHCERMVDRGTPHRLVLPSDDDQHAVSAALNEVLAVVDVHDSLLAIAHRHANDAPVSAAHVRELPAAVAATVLQWIERWPS